MRVYTSDRYQLVELVSARQCTWSRRCSGHGRADCTPYNLTACLEALELIQITLSANGAFSAEIQACRCGR
jgi:hypothetical protein